MSKSKKDKKSKKTSDKSSKKESKASEGKTTYKRGALGQAIFAHIKDVGVDNVKYDDCLEIAVEVLPTTKFNKSHFSWYKNKHRERAAEAKADKKTKK